ncbi:MAG TPA: helix-turn-helix domain-containing protein [Nocardioidaceae bacterium]|nr:helix-turn-helix domain-containing protein [Nocardioidaceae bacterium]
MPPETSQTLARGLRVLRLLADEPRGVTMTELARRVDVNRTVAYRLVATLVEFGLARRDDEGRVYVGVGVIELARAIEPLLRDQARPILRKLAEDVGATAHLTVAEGDEALAIAVIEPSWTDYHVAYRVGTRHPLDRGAAGRAIELGRTDGAAPYSLTRDELQPGASGLAAPVRGIPGLECSVGVVALGELDVDAVGVRVVRAAAELAKRLS